MTAGAKRSADDDDQSSTAVPIVKTEIVSPSYEDSSAKRRKLDAEDEIAASSAMASEEADTAVESAAAGVGRFRVRVENLYKYADKKEILKICLKVNITNVDSVKKAPGWGYCFLLFQSEADRADAIKKLNGYEYRNRELEVFPVQEIEREEVKGMAGRAQSDVAKDGGNDGRTREERLADAVTPLWKQPYDMQLKAKHITMMKAMKQLRDRLVNYFPKRYQWMSAPRPESGAEIPAEEDSLERIKRQLAWLGHQYRINPRNIPCELLEVMPSPVLYHYRNKCEFTFGWNEAGEKVAGFLCGAYKDGVVTVVEAELAKNVSPAGAELARSLSKFLRSSSLPIYDRIAKNGFWRQALVRTHSTGENMLVVSYNPRGMDEAGLEVAHKELRDHFESEKGSEKGATTLLVQQHEGDFNGMVEDAPLVTLYGAGVVHETILGLRFRISPTAFFQVNTEATNTLYSLVRDWCALDEVQGDRASKILAPIPADVVKSEVDGTSSTLASASHPKDLSPPGTVLLDLCCGTGTIGLTMASHVKKVIGVDMINGAIDDARYNVTLNGGDPEGKITYYADKVEHVIREIVKEHVGVNDDVVVVLDPPRVGVYYGVIATVRACARVNRVIYVSCDASQAVSNFVDLCRPTSSKFKGEPFRPVRAQPMDLFPHTKHCELVIEFRR
ncbi:tRNA methyltransferase 2 [Geranomyces variabilis]|uniref:tRNA methyltransferase 2 n=1 Tax=Geranomyces variabilis TaxID=109894 RepID=A0AAD5TMB9_9FUNG|nr:tRNA methyltransferase 2 [Geranomyces variabilis]